MAAQRGPWAGLTGLQKAAVLLGVPAGATVLYILYRRYRESREERVTFVAGEELETEVRVPRAAVKSIIGRKGVTIRKLRQETGARIDVESEEESEETALLISGSPGQVCRARAAVHRILAESTPVSEQLCVPQRAVGRIIGRGGETVRGICRSSGARVLCEREPGPAALRVIQLSGTRQEVAAAKKLILQKLREDGASRGELPQGPAGRTQRKQPLGRRQEPEPREEEDGDGWGDGSGTGPAASPELQEENPELSEENQELGTLDTAALKLEAPSPGVTLPEGPMEVCVSASRGPGCFWVQFQGQGRLQLDQLRARMRLFYSSPCTAELSDLSTGAVVAAPYGGGGDWGRARVLALLENGNVQLYYVDFGGEGEAPGAALRALRSDFLSLRFQAMECSLAGVAPAGSGWSEAALEAFDRFTGCARWQPLVAKISSYIPEGSGTRPCVQLFTHGNESLDIGAELVRLGHAVPCPEERPRGHSPPLSVPAEVPVSAHSTGEPAPALGAPVNRLLLALESKTPSPEPETPSPEPATPSPESR